MRAVLASVMVVFVSLGLFHAGSWPAWMPVLGWASLGALWLELRAVPQRGFGFFSSAFSVYLGLALWSAAGPTWALALAWAGMLLRSFVCGNVRGAVRWREALADFVPVVAALGAAAWTSAAVLPLALYLVLSLSIPEWLAEESPGVETHLWHSLRQMTGYHNFAVGFLGPVFALLLPQGASAILLLPVLATLHRAARTDLLRLEELEKRHLEKKIARTQQQLVEEKQTGARLSLWVERLSFLLKGARALGATTDRSALLDRFRQILEEMIPHRQGLVVLHDQLEAGWGPELEQIPWKDWCTFLQAGQRPPAGVLAVLLEDEDGCMGAVFLSGGSGEAEQAYLLQLVCAQLVSALRRAQLESQIRQSQANLAQTSKMAAVGQLAAGIAHELNTPLGAVMLQIDSAMVSATRKPELVPDKLELAVRALETVQTIVSKLLYYSRSQSGGQRPLDLNEVVRDTLLLMERQIQIDGLQFSTQLQPVPKVLANPTELQQVLTNLLLNARDAAAQKPPGTVLVRTAAADSLVLLEVVDSGPGVEREALGHLFEPFFTTKPVGQGTGLGLSIALEIVQQHKGRLELVHPGDPTIFRLTLPQLPNTERVE
ncbi:MAG: ATP-binding protein [Vulcanimicrobiota bacterium]